MSQTKKRAPAKNKKADVKEAAEIAIAKDLGFSVRKTGSFLDFPTNRKPAYCYGRDGEWVGDARPEAVQLWNYAVKLKAEELRLEESEL